MDMQMNFYRKLPIPRDLKEQFPADERVVQIKNERDPEIARIFEGKSDRLLLIIGPCSADNEVSVLDYVSRLAKVQEKVKDKIWIVPRIYTNKPRTTGGGYKGLIHQPDPEKKPDMWQGIISVRELHQKAILESGLTCADEMLYPENHRYVSDLLSYVAIGARSVENQEHRLVSSGAGIPVGMKNPTAKESWFFPSWIPRPTRPDLSERLPRFNGPLYQQVKEVLEVNKAQRHIRGGIATRKKYRGI